MPELAELLTRLRHEEEPLARADRILEWAIEELGLQGVALIRAEPSSAVGLRVLRATGSLCGLSAEVVNDLLPAGLPAQSCILALPAALPTVFPAKAVGYGSNGGSSIPDALYCAPLNRQNGVPWSALVLDSNDLSQLTRDNDERLQMASSLLRDALENEELRRQLRMARTRNGVFALGDSTDGHPVAPEIDSLVDGLQLPLYLCDSHGKFLYASAAFLRLTGFATVEALSRATGLFGDPVKRRQELETVLSAGKVSAVPITVTAADGKRLQIQESALSMGDRVLGVFFDVSDLMEANKELKDSLQVQEFLNDSIIAGTRMLRRTQGASIRALARLAEYRNPETGYHLQRICEYARLLAVQVYERAPYSFRITREYGDDISLSSMLHDIGKVSIPDSILLKPGRLDSDEWEIMKRHTVFGWEVLSKADKELGEQSFLTLAATIALSHHERFDGTGYPRGIAGENIPLSARISSLADVYDALTTARPYKEPWSHERAMEEIVRQSGCQFDPVLVGILQEVHDQFAEVHRLFPG